MLFNIYTLNLLKSPSDLTVGFTEHVLCKKNKYTRVNFHRTINLVMLLYFGRFAHFVQFLFLFGPVY